MRTLIIPALLIASVAAGIAMSTAVAYRLGKLQGVIECSIRHIEADKRAATAAQWEQH